MKYKIFLKLVCSIWFLYRIITFQFEAKISLPDPYDYRTTFQKTGIVDRTNITNDKSINSAIIIKGYMLDLFDIIKELNLQNEDYQKFLDYLKQTNYKDFVILPELTKIERFYIVDAKSIFY